MTCVAAYFDLISSPLQICVVFIEMDEQTGSPAANTDTSTQRNGDEVPRTHLFFIWKLESPKNKTDMFIFRVLIAEGLKYFF